MPTVNLASKYSSLLDKRFAQKSLTDAWCGHDYEFDGVNTIKVWTILNPKIHDYNPQAGSNRYGTPEEIGDQETSYTLSRKRAFTGIIDITNVQDQLGIKKANSVLKQIWDEEMVPEIDMYRLGTWANGAGTVKIGSALTKTSVIEALLEGHAAMSNRHVPSDQRVTFVSHSLAVKCKLAQELQYNESFTGKAIINGQVAKMNGSPIVAVPDDYFPAGVQFMIKYKRATADPTKLRKLKAHEDPPGIAGTLLEGLTRYDSFVLAQKAFGIYVYASSGAAAVPEASDEGGQVTLTSTDSGTIHYTDDGSNPKTSGTAKVYSQGITAEKGTLLRFYASKEGMLSSGIGECVCKGAE